MLVSGDGKTFVTKNRDYFSDEKSVAHLPKANRGLMTKGLRISFAIDDPVQTGRQKQSKRRTDRKTHRDQKRPAEGRAEENESSGMTEGKIADHVYDQLR